MAGELAAEGAKLILITDCVAVVSGYFAALGRAITCKGAYSGFWTTLGISRVEAVRKVKSHQTQRSSDARGKGHWHLGNHIADESAREAVHGPDELQAMEYI